MHKTIALLALLFAACEVDPDESFDFRGLETESGGEAEEWICEDEATAHIYHSQSDCCDPGYMHPCTSGEFEPDGGFAARSMCCDANTDLCESVAWGTECDQGLTHECDVPAAWACAPEGSTLAFINTGPWCKPGQQHVCTVGLFDDGAEGKLCCPDNGAPGCQFALFWQGCNNGYHHACDIIP